jgi:DNA-binding GntR family transcriptional regulator
MIHSGEFDAEEKLSIISLSEKLGVSRTPVRDALWQLAGEGLVTVSPRVGAFLRRVTPREAADIYRLKQSIEPIMASWATERASHEERARYRAMVEDLAIVAKTEDVERYVARLEECRAELLRMADSPPLVDILAVIDGRVRLLRFRSLSQPGQLNVSANQHIAVADAVASGDAQAAMSQMAEHMRYASRRAQRLLQRSKETAGGYWLFAPADPDPDPDGPRDLT